MNALKAVDANHTGRWKLKRIQIYNATYPSQTVIRRLIIVHPGLGEDGDTLGIDPSGQMKSCNSSIVYF